MKFSLLTLQLAGLSMVGPFAVDAFLPSMQGIGQEFHVGPAALQQMLSVYLAAFAGTSLFYGTLSDSFGRRRVILAALAIFSLASLGAAMAPSFGFLLVCRFLQGLSASAGPVIGRAIVTDIYAGADAKKVMSQVMTVFALAPAIAPIIGGHLHVAFGWPSVFLCMMAFSLLLLTSCYRSMNETLPRAERTRFHPRTILRNYGKALGHAEFVTLCLAQGATFGGLALYIASASTFIMDVLHRPATAFGWLFIPVIIGMVAGSNLCGYLAHRVSQQTLVFYGYGILATAAVGNVLLCLLIPAQVPWAVLPVALYSLGMALLIPEINIAGQSLLPRIRGLASSLLGSTQMLFFALISGLLAPLIFHSALLLAWGMLGFFALSLLCWLTSRRLHQPQET